MSKKLRALIALVVVLAVAGAAIAFAVSNASVETVEVADVTSEDLSVVVSASGSVEAETRTDVYPPTAGTLASLAVASGDEVTAGQVLAVMDTAPIEVQVAQAQAAYQGAIAQRSAITASAPGASALQAAQAAVDAAWSAYSLAKAAYDAAAAGLGAPSASDIASAQSAVALAQTAADAAKAAYDAYYTTVYLPAPTPRDAALESTLAALSLVLNQANASLADAKMALAALMASADNTANVASAKIARDQAYAGYLAAVSQRDALAKSSSVGAALASANAAVAAAEAALAFASDTLDRAEIVAPVSGVVLFSGSASAASLLSGAGGGASGGDLGVGSSVSPASAPFSIVSFDTLAFTANVDETDVARIEVGMKAIVSLDGITDAEFEAEVQRIGKEAVVTTTGGTAYPVHIVFAAEDAGVLLGMNGSAEIEVDTIGSAVTFPVEALLEDGETSYVYVVADGRAKRVEVEVGRLTDTRVEVLSGLVEGDQVIVSGVANLSDGARVRTE